MEEIRKGLEAGLSEDKVKIYANPKFDSYQMKEILCGLVYNIDVSIYAKPEFDSDQMRQLRQSLMEDLDVSCYESCTYCFERIHEILRSLVETVDEPIFRTPCEETESDNVSKKRVKTQNI